jgi:two-component system, NtrC family, sensor kinase
MTMAAQHPEAFLAREAFFNGGTSSRRILVVDDDAEMHAFFHKAFPSSSNASKAAQPDDPRYEVDFALQGQEGCERIKSAVASSQPYAVAFVGASTPAGWDGLQTTANILEADQDVQVVVCAGQNGCHFDEMVRRIGRSDRFVILKKPFAVPEIKQLVAAFAGKWELSRHFRESNHRWRESEQCHLMLADELETRVFDQSAELASTRLRLEHLLRSSPAVIYSMRITNPPAFTFVSDNFTALFGYKPAEMLVDPDFFVRHLHAEDAAQVSAHRARRLEEGRLAVDFRFLHKDGSYRWVHDHARVICDSRGVPVEIIGSFSDITDRKEADKELRLMDMQLRQAQKLEAIGQLASGIAHEINTPIQYVGDNTRFLKDSFVELQKILHSHQEILAAARNNALTPEGVARAREVIAAADLDYLFLQVPSAINETLEGVERVTKIVRAMKEFSHPGGTEKSAADINKAIESTITVARNEWKYVAEMKLELDPDLPFLPCFLGEFNQVILNLVINAAHAIGDVVRKRPGEKGLITVSTRRDGDIAEVRVSDTGTGIPENVRPRIFEPFFTTKEPGKGTGQGLSIVYGSIVKKHGGTVAFETQDGRGTTFILRLPLASPP